MTATGNLCLKGLDKEFILTSPVKFAHFLDETLSPFFYGLRPCLLDLRAVIAERLEALTHEDVLEILSRHLASLGPGPLQEQTTEPGIHHLLPFYPSNHSRMSKKIVQATPSVCESTTSTKVAPCVSGYHTSNETRTTAVAAKTRRLSSRKDDVVEKKLQLIGKYDEDGEENETASRESSTPAKLFPRSTHKMPVNDGEDSSEDEENMTSLVSPLPPRLSPLKENGLKRKFEIIDNYDNDEETENAASVEASAPGLKDQPFGDVDRNLDSPKVKKQKI
jgi:hypothetical protein